MPTYAVGTDSAPDLVISPGTGAAQSATLLEVPNDGRIVSVGSYIRALSGTGSLDYRLAVWAWDGSVGGANKLLGKSAVRTVSSAASAPGNLLRQVADLETPVELGAFDQVLVGVAWETDPARQALLGGYTGTGSRYRKDLAEGAVWPSSMKSAVHLTDHNFAAWIDAYVPTSGVFVFRAGDWQQAELVEVRRSGLWSAGTVKVRRAGGWISAD